MPLKPNTFQWVKMQFHLLREPTFHLHNPTRKHTNPISLIYPNSNLSELSLANKLIFSNYGTCIFRMRLPLHHDHRDHHDPHQVENSLSTYEPHACVVVYSIVDRNTFRVAEEILNYLWSEKYTKEKAVIIAANKSDLARSRVINTSGRSASHSIFMGLLARAPKNSIQVGGVYATALLYLGANAHIHIYHAMSEEGFYAFSFYRFEKIYNC